MFPAHLDAKPKSPPHAKSTRSASPPSQTSPVVLAWMVKPNTAAGVLWKMMKTYYLYEKLWRKIHLCLKSPTFFRKFGKCRFGFACQIWLKRGRILVSLPCLFTRHPHFYTSGGPKWSSKGSNHPFPCLIMFGMYNPIYGMYNPIYGMYNPIKITSYN